MSTPTKRRVFASEKNGEIVCERLDGRWVVTVDGFDQSSPYIAQMWLDAFRHLPKSNGVQRVLLLGLGAGAVLDPLCRWFPGCSVTAVEWDPVMAGLSTCLSFFPPRFTPDIRLGDAADVLPTLEGPFDLVVCDLFRGRETAAVIATPAFIREIGRLLRPSGRLLINFFDNAALFPVFDGALERVDAWHFQYNLLAAYRKEDQSLIGSWSF